LKASDDCIDLIEKFEGLRLTAYKCPAGVWTIGLGSTRYPDGSAVKQGDTITKQRAYEILTATLGRYERAVSKYVTAVLEQCQFDALVDFCYNLGEGNLAKSTLLKKVNANPDDKAIAAEFRKWNKAGGKVLTGLTKRRQAEIDLYFKDGK
jgi:lysozyme